MRNAKLGVLVLVVGVMGVAACAPEETKPQSEEWTIEDDARLGTPAFAAPKGVGPTVLAPRVDPSVATVSFLDRNRARFGLRAPKEELRKLRADVDALSMTHVRLQQVERGVPVAGGEVLAHYDAAGRVTSVQERYVPGLASLDLTPAIDEAAASRVAIEEARRLVPAIAAEALELAADPVLVVLADGGVKPVLAWQIEVRSGARHGWRIGVDAKTGAIVERIDQVEDIVGSGVALDGKVRPLNYARSTNTGGNVLADVTRPARIVTRDSTGTRSATPPLFTSEDGKSWDTASATAAGAAVDAHTNMAAVTDYFAKTFARKGWDDENGAMTVLVHFEDDDGTGLDNAFYSRTSNVIAFGDGKAKFKPLAGSLDITAHEYTHAVIATSSNLVYKDQSGALNESIADVFGAVVEHAIDPDPVDNWLLGEGSLRAGPQALRDLGAPEKGKQPKHMKELVQTTTDNGGVHINSGIPNHAAFLATMGGTNTVSKVKVNGGIGWDNLAKVWYRANATYLTTSSDFAAMAKATLLAAADLKLTPAEVDALDCAWKAVGVTQGECAAPPPPPPAAPAMDDDAPANEEPEDVGVTPAKADEELPASAEEEEEEKPAKRRKVLAGDDEEAPAAAAAGCSTTNAKTEAPWSALLGVLGLALVLRRRATR
ncbi:MAG: M4 family metallopeptidase [Labilithrix sp.]|nr:M4 family metallopeptidase [Labilithrix sp.]MCW5815200.1 M4 family metallopeptidase [Labilithrix sp.]